MFDSTLSKVSLGNTEHSWISCQISCFHFWLFLPYYMPEHKHHILIPTSIMESWRGSFICCCGQRSFWTWTGFLHQRIRLFPCWESCWDAVLQQMKQWLLEYSCMVLTPPFVAKKISAFISERDTQHTHSLLFNDPTLCVHTQSYLTLCDPMDCGPLGSSVHEISQARILEWVAISYSRGFSQPRDQPVSPALAGGFFTTEPPGRPFSKSLWSWKLLGSFPLGMSHYYRKTGYSLASSECSVFEALQTWSFPVAHSLLCLWRDPRRPFPPRCSESSNSSTMLLYFLLSDYACGS